MGSGLGSQGFRQGTGLETLRLRLRVGVEISRKSGSQEFDRLRTLDFPFAGREWEVEILTNKWKFVGRFWSLRANSASPIYLSQSILG